MTIALTNCRILLSGGFAEDKAVLIEDGEIAAIAPADDKRLTDADCRDLGGRFLLPGFIDTQVNGGGGVMFNDAPTVETIRTIGAGHRRFGTTGFLPTLITDDVDKMRQAIAAVNAAMAEGAPGVLGVHLEGPLLAPERRGIHDAGKFRRFDDEMLELIGGVETGRTIVTLAADRVAPADIARLSARGVLVSIGHSAADYGQTRAALDAGARGFTHLFNAMTQMENRQPGVVGAALEDPASWCGLIVDGFHAHPACMKIAVAAKARGHMMLVTDAMAPVGAEDNSFEWCGEIIECRNGRCATKDGTLAGSALDMAAAVRNTVAMLDLPLAEAVRMASLYPARFLKLEGMTGQITAGRRANFVVMNEALAVEQVWIDGKA